MPHTLPVPLTETPRRTPEEARTALLAIAKRSPHLLDVATVDMLLSNVSHVGAMLCALGSNYSTPGCDDFDLVQVLLGHLAGVYFEAGKRSAFDQVIAVESREPTNPVSAPIERLSHDKAKAALLAIAARSPNLVSADEIADMLGDEGELVNFLCAQLTGLGVVKIGPGNLHGDSDGALLLTALLGYIAERYFTLGQESARVKTGCALRATLPDGTTVLLPEGTEISTVDKPDPIADQIGKDTRAFTKEQRWDEGECDPIRDIRTAMEMPRTVDIEQVKL